MIDQVVLKKNMFENNTCLSARGKGRQALEINFFPEHKYFVNWVIYCKFFTLNAFLTVFPVQTQATN